MYCIIIKCNKLHEFHGHLLILIIALTDQIKVQLVLYHLCVRVQLFSSLTA